MNEIVVPWRRAQKIAVTRSRAYKKNDQAFVEQKNGAVVRRLVGYDRFVGAETARVLIRLYATAMAFLWFQCHRLIDQSLAARIIAEYGRIGIPYSGWSSHLGTEGCGEAPCWSACATGVII
jgi:hypothetical protein